MDGPCGQFSLCRTASGHLLGQQVVVGFDQHAYGRKQTVLKIGSFGFLGQHVFRSSVWLTGPSKFGFMERKQLKTSIKILK
ncbi:hypothetical protein HanPSC8_Chr05g0198511 [Helianthus annuus]|nr:hypothetical protein HanPSC8_Chr05g0198511 [Helianthus annuus]